MPETSPRRYFFPALLACFFLSGAAGLIDQVVWSKALGLIFGHTAYAVATVLAVFMAGLAAGSAWIGGRSERWNRPIALYAWLEFGVAATAAISLLGLSAVRAVYVAAYPHVAGSAGVLLVLRFTGSALVLFLPTFLMGGTLPVLVRGLTRTAADLGARVSRLYWINTAGAVAGTFAAGFLFLPALGLRLTLAIAVTLNLAAGALALVVERERRGRAASPSDATVSPEHAQSGGAPFSQTAPSTFLLVSFAIVGATAMSYEIGWTRLLSTQLGSSTYAFTLMLGTFLTGIVLGSALFERWSRRRVPGARTFAATQTLTALAAIAFLIFFTRLIEVLPPILRATHESFRGLVLGQFVTQRAGHAAHRGDFRIQFSGGGGADCRTSLGDRNRLGRRGGPRLRLEHARCDRGRDGRRLLADAAPWKFSPAGRHRGREPRARRRNFAGVAPQRRPAKFSRSRQTCSCWSPPLSSASPLILTIPPWHRSTR